MNVAEAVRQLGGIARTSELTARGVSPKSVAAAVVAGDIVRLRIGWYGVPSLSDLVQRAHRIGGRPACASVAALRGLWMLSPPSLHVELTHTKSRLRRSPDENVRLHWTDHPVGVDRMGAPIAVALEQMSTCLSADDAVCTIDSALNRGVVSIGELWRGAGPRMREILVLCDARAESGVESIFRVRASAAGYVFRTQARISGGRVDFLFGDRLIFEVDGSEFHSGHDEFVKDRERDAWHNAIGYKVVRVTYRQVIDRWHEIESLLQLLHARNAHLDRSRIRGSTRRAGSTVTLNGESVRIS